MKNIHRGVRRTAHGDEFNNWHAPVMRKYLEPKHYVDHVSKSLILKYLCWILY